MAEPTTAPSERAAISLAWVGVEMPKPMAQGSSGAAVLASRIISPTLPESVWRTPVTPREDTQ